MLACGGCPVVLVCVAGAVLLAPLHSPSASLRHELTLLSSWLLLLSTPVPPVHYTTLISWALLVHVCDVVGLDGLCGSLGLH